MNRFIYLVKDNQDVYPLAFYCRKIKLDYKIVASRIRRRKLTSPDGFLTINVDSKEGKEIFSLIPLMVGGSIEARRMKKLSI